MASNLCRELDCTLSLDFFLCMGGSVAWLFAGVAIVFARDRDKVITENLEKSSMLQSSNNTLVVPVAASAQSVVPTIGPTEEVTVTRLANEDGSITEITKTVLVYPNGSSTTTETSRVVYDENTEDATSIVEEECSSNQWEIEENQEEAENEEELYLEPVDLDGQDEEKFATQFMHFK